MKRYIRASSDQDDVTFFDLPRAYCTRLKQYIIDNDPDMLPKEIYSGEPYTDEDFIGSVVSLQLIFDSKLDLELYVSNEFNYCPTNSSDYSKLKSILDHLVPKDISEPEQDQKYVISGFDPVSGEEPFAPRDTDKPDSAIAYWFSMSDKYPLCVCICAKDDAAAEELLSWVVDNEDKFREIYKQHNNPYKLEFLVNYCKRHVNDSNLIDWSGDQVSPFSLG